MDAVGFFQAVDVSDVRMIQCGQEFGLALEPRHALGITGKKLGQNFQGDIAFQPGVAGAIHFSHSAGADLFLNTIVGNGLVKHGLAGPC